MSGKKQRGLHEDMGSFYIRVQARQNHSWQGSCEWVDEQKTIHFRSIGELIRAMEEALDSVDGEKDVRSFLE